MKYTIKRIVNIIASLILAVLVGLPYFSASPMPVAKVSADNSVKPLDETYIIDDLGEEVVSNFKEVDGAKPQLYSFSEFGFSQNAVLRETAYGLYLYVYNPSRTRYATADGANTVSMAINYNASGIPIAYKNLPLKNCGYTTGKYDKLVYKFRVLNTEKIEANALKGDIEGGKRRYDLVGFQLLAEGAKLAKDYGVSTVYHISGYGEGMGKGAELKSTLKIEWGQLDTIQLKIQHANYRTMDFNSENICDELNTVYFSVPERYFSEYGGLQKIKAEWYEYKTNPVFVTKDETAYNELKGYIGTDIGTENDDLDYGVVWDIKSESVGNVAYGHYNALGKFTLGDYVGVYKGDSVSRMDWLFYVEGVKGRDDYSVTREAVKSYMAEYTTNNPVQRKVLNKYAENLFASSIDSDRLSLLENQAETRGYIVQEIDAGDAHDLLFGVDQSWWSKLWNGAQFESKDVSPIVVLTASDIAGLNSDTFAEKYLIGNADKDAVFSNVNQMIENGERAVLFRFAVTDYYASTAHFESWRNPFGSNADGYVAQETVFLNFDIISLTFRKNGVDTVIACVSDPIDIINGFDPPEGLDAGKDNSGTLKKLIALIVLIAVVIFIVWLISKLRGNKVTVKVKHNGKKKH